MFKLSMRNIWSHKGRLLLTAIAVIAGTAFLSGVFVFTDTIKGTFDRIFADAYADTDAVVRSRNEIDSAGGGDSQRALIDASLVDLVAGVPGVSLAEGDVTASATVTTSDGEIVGQDGPPKFGGVFSDSALSAWAIDDGDVPSGGDQVVLDVGSADKYDVVVGDTVTITARAQPRQFTVSGTATFAGNDSLAGATFALFDLPTAQEFLLGDTTKVDSVLAKGDGSVGQQELADRIQAAVGQDDLETLTGTQMSEEAQSDIQEALGFVTIFLSIFALISLFVGSFIIYNVFSISAAQRQRENALLRAIGASRGQVVRAQFVEALVVGIGGSLLGLLGGLGLAAAILAIMSSAGIGLADSALVIKPDGFVIAFVIGVLVTLLCAIAPALRSGRVPPLAAMRDVSIDRTDASRRRLLIGVGEVVLAVLAVAAGVVGSALWLGIGVILLFVALVTLGPAIAAPIARAATPILSAIAGTVGMVAGRNAARNPKRTALTAGALGVGLALLIGVATLGSSVKASIREAFGASFIGDYTVTPTQGNSGVGVPPTVAQEINDGGKAVALGLAGGGLRLDFPDGADNTLAFVVDPAAAAQVFTLDFTSGSFADLTGEGIILHGDDTHGLAVGDTVEATMLDGTARTLTVQGVFESEVFTSPVVANTLFDGTGTFVVDVAVFVKGAEGVPDDEVRASVQSVVDQYPTVQLQSRDEYIDDQTAQIDDFLGFIYALLGMSVFIAVIGIVITLSLAVYERRRELGLVRAVGMTRPQVRRSIVWESIVTAIIGVVMGTVLGVALGWIVVQALSDEGLDTFALPVGSIVGFIVMALALAAVASFQPAWKGARSDILEAIATT
jgi:putative ABC transport system permease protein